MQVLLVLRVATDTFAMKRFGDGTEASPNSVLQSRKLANIATGCCTKLMTVYPGLAD